MGADQEHSEARSRLKAYLKWKSIQADDPKLSFEGRTAVLDALHADGLAALGEFIDVMAEQAVLMIRTICDGDPAEVADTIASLVVSDAQANDVLRGE